MGFSASGVCDSNNLGWTWIWDFFFFSHEAAKVALEFGEREVEGEELPWVAEAESRRDDRRRQRRRQTLCSWRWSAAAWWHCQQKVLVTLFTAGERAAEKLCVLSRAEKGLVTEQEPNPDLPLSVADSQWCSSFLQVVLTLFIMWVDANLMMLQGEKWMVACIVIVKCVKFNEHTGFLDVCSVKREVSIADA